MHQEGCRIGQAYPVPVCERVRPYRQPCHRHKKGESQNELVIVGLGLGLGIGLGLVPTIQSFQQPSAAALTMIKVITDY